MRRLKLVLGVAALMVAMLVATAAPAAAQTIVNFGGGDDFCEDFDGDFCDFDEFCEDFDEDFICDLDEFCEDFDEDFICDFDDFDNDFVDFADGIDQDVEQEAESGDVDQSFDVSQTGDNSNQTVSTQGVANTGNAQNVIGVSDGFFDDEFFDDRFFFGDFDGDGFDDGLQFEDVGASIEVSPEQVVTSDQEVNQAATATD
jgi:hypothetical protein